MMMISIMNNHFHVIQVSEQNLPFFSLYNYNNFGGKILTEICQYFKVTGIHFKNGSNAALVGVQSEQDAMAAVIYLNGYRIGGRKIKVSRFDTNFAQDDENFPLVNRVFINFKALNFNSIFKKIV